MVLILLGMLFFVASHSLLASQSIKAAIKTRIGERAYLGFYRLTYNGLSTLIIFPILGSVYDGPGHTVWAVEGLVKIVFLFIQGVGVLGLAWALLQVDLGRFLGISQVMAYFQGKPLPLPREDLVTHGAYALVRHPLYFFAFLVIWPMPIMADTLFVFNLIATLYCIIGSRWEEQRMIQSFGERYERYRKQVPWLLPLPRRSG